MAIKIPSILNPKRSRLRSYAGHGSHIGIIDSKVDTMSHAQAQLLDTLKVAQYCGVSRSAVESWLQNGRLSAERRGTEYLIKAHDLVHFMHHNHLAIPVELQHSETANVPQTARVVVVDEDRPMAISIERVLRNLDLEVMRINRGSEADAALKRYQPQLVTLDLSLEGLNGVELIQHICTSFSPRPKILVITDSMPSLLSKARLAGADAILSKPFDNDALRRNVRILLGMD